MFTVNERLQAILPLVGAFLIISGLALFIIGLISACDHDVSYVGTEVFTTEEQYTQFKTVYASALQDDKIGMFQPSFNYINALSSDPPIVVNFDLSADVDYFFPYGERGRNPMSGGWIMFGVGLAAIVGGASIAYGCRDR